MKKNHKAQKSCCFPLKMSCWWILFLASSVNDGAGTWTGYVMKEFLQTQSRENWKRGDFHCGTIWNGRCRTRNSGEKASCWNTYVKSYSTENNKSNRKPKSVLDTKSWARRDVTGQSREEESTGSTAKLNRVSGLRTRQRGGLQEQQINLYISIPARYSP